MDRFGGGRRPSGQRCNVGAAWIRSKEPLDVTTPGRTNRKTSAARAASRNSFCRLPLTHSLQRGSGAFRISGGWHGVCCSMSQEARP